MEECGCDGRECHQQWTRLDMLLGVADPGAYWPGRTLTNRRTHSVLLSIVFVWCCVVLSWRSAYCRLSFVINYQMKIFNLTKLGSWSWWTNKGNKGKDECNEGVLIRRGFRLHLSQHYHMISFISISLQLLSSTSILPRRSDPSSPLMELPHVVMVTKLVPPIRDAQTEQTECNVTLQVSCLANHAS